MEAITLTFNLPLAPGLNGSGGLMRLHWRKLRKLRDSFAYGILADILQLPPADRSAFPLPMATVTITRVACGVRPDDDNLRSSAKLILDALVDARVLVDDSPSHVTHTVAWLRAAKPAEQRTVVHVVGERGERSEGVTRATQRATPGRSVGDPGHHLEGGGSPVPPYELNLSPSRTPPHTYTREELVAAACTPRKKNKRMRGLSQFGRQV